MTEEVRSRAFEPFFTTKEVHKGTGLGLSMVYGLARQSGGTVTIDSEIGRGTTVRIYLPRAPQRTADADEADERSRWDAGPPSRILVVDDNSAVRAITAIMLRTLGHDAIEAAGGEDALDLLEHDRQFDLLIVDLAMPNMHGDEFVAKARELVPSVPALFVTGYAEPGRMRQGAEGGLLKKPFRRAQLAETLRWILRPPVQRSGRNAIASKPQ
jgi:CheY-like chemotaxis protein